VRAGGKARSWIGPQARAAGQPLLRWFGLQGALSRTWSTSGMALWMMVLLLALLVMFYL